MTNRSTTIAGHTGPTMVTTTGTVTGIRATTDQDAHRTGTTGISDLIRITWIFTGANTAARTPRTLAISTVPRSTITMALILPNLVLASVSHTGNAGVLTTIGNHHARQRFRWAVTALMILGTWSSASGTAMAHHPPRTYQSWHQHVPAYQHRGYSLAPSYRWGYFGARRSWQGYDHRSYHGDWHQWQFRGSW